MHRIGFSTYRTKRLKLQGWPLPSALDRFNNFFDRTVGHIMLRIGIFARTLQPELTSRTKNSTSDRRHARHGDIR